MTKDATTQENLTAQTDDSCQLFQPSQQTDTLLSTVPDSPYTRHKTHHLQGETLTQTQPC